MRRRLIAMLGPAIFIVLALAAAVTVRQWPDAARAKARVDTAV